ncbi:IS30 family transposase [Mycoplasma sp. B6400]|uniref:IS30 family transposase n=1 Tax=Mycoplasma sp. B6400 TaxID=3401674 RepID=UPI003AAC20D3
MHKKNIICVETIKRVDNYYNTKNQIVKYEHFILRPYKDKILKTKLNNELNKARNQNTNHFQLSDLSSLFDNLQKYNSLIEISKVMNKHIKTIKNNIENAAEEYKYTTTAKCKKCKTKIMSVTYLSIEEWTDTKIALAQNIYETNVMKSCERLKPIQDFLVEWSNLRKKYRKIRKENPSLDLGENIKYTRQISVARLLDEYIEKYKNQNVFIPTLQTFYNAIDTKLDIDYSMFVGKKGMSNSIFDKSEKKKKRKYKKPKIQGAISIHNRDESINKRIDFGHYEMDTVVFNKSSKFILVTVYERKARLGYAMLSRRDAHSVALTVQKIIKLYNLTIKTLTIDNGSENTLLYTIPEIGEIYTCDPYSSYQKGGIECWHKELRKFIPKGKYYSWINDQSIMNICHIVNSSKREYMVPESLYTVRMSAYEFYSTYY